MLAVRRINAHLPTTLCGLFLTCRGKIHLFTLVYIQQNKVCRVATLLLKMFLLRLVSSISSSISSVVFRVNCGRCPGPNMALPGVLLNPTPASSLFRSSICTDLPTRKAPPPQLSLRVFLASPLLLSYLLPATILPDLSIPRMYSSSKAHASRISTASLYG